MYKIKQKYRTELPATEDTLFLVGVLLLRRGRRRSLSERANQIKHVVLLSLGSLGLRGLLLSISGVLIRRGRGRIIAATEFGTESSETTGLVVLDVHQLAAGGVPEDGVARVARGAVDGRWGGRAVGESATVGEGDELCEGVGTLGAAEQGCVAALRADEGCARLRQS